MLRGAFEGLPTAKMGRKRPREERGQRANEE